MKLRKVLLSAAVAAIPVNVLALGLGNAQISSALNEPLQARIDLFSVQNTELEDIKAGLASTSEFQRAGLEWTRNLSELRFKVMTGPGGKPYISVTSRQPVREPFLNFLIEVNWPAGRLLREYTVLLDPPVYGAAMQKAISPTVTTAPDQSQQTVASGPPPVSKTVSPPAPRGAAAISDGKYGPVQRNETLWSIATAVRPDSGVSVQQTMLAMVEANPEAFINGNVNALKEGYILRIPGREEIAGRSQQEALAEVKRQYQLWQEQRLGSTAAMTPVGDTAETGSQAGTVEEEARLKLLSAGSGERGAGTGGTKALQESLTLAEEERDSAKAENAELKSRVAQTEAMLEDFQRLLKLKDENIAELQRRLREEQSMIEEGAPAMEAAESMAEPEPAGEAAAPMEGMAESEAGGETAMPAEEPVTPEQEPAPMAEEPAAPPKRAPILPPPAAPEPAGLLDSLPVSPAILGAGLGGLVLLLVGGLLLRKKRAASAEDTAEAPAAGAPVTEAPVVPEPEKDSDATAEFGPGEVEEKKPAEEERTSPEAFSDTMVQDAAAREDDALDEVNVYLAYERYDQAEQLVRKAIAAHPENEAYHLKLLEIHHTAKNVDGFRKDAATLRNLVGAGAPAMTQALGWWEEIAPGATLFADADADAAPEVGAESEFEKTMGSAEPPGTADDLDFDLTGDEEAVVAAEDAASGDEAGAEDNLDLDFDLGLEGDEASETGERAASEDLDLELEGGEEGAATNEAATDDGMGLDFDLGEAAEPSADKAEGDDLDLDLGGAEDEAGASDGGLDFDLGEGEGGEGEDKGTPAAKVEDSEDTDELDFDLSEGESADLDFDLGEGEEEGPEATTRDEMDLDFDLGEAGDEKAGDEKAGDGEGPAEGDAKAEEGAESAIDFDIGGDAESDQEEMPTLEEEPQASERLDTVALDNLDMDLDAGTGESKAEAADDESGVGLELETGEDAATAKGEAEDEDELDLDFSGFEVSEDEDESAGTGSESDTDGAAAEGGEGPEIDFDLDLGFDDDDEPEKTLALGKEMEGDLDEVGTKLDLAQAYIDMGNADGARTILNEVMSEGDDQQKSEAQQLLDKLE